jgi:exonuclease SbcD
LRIIHISDSHAGYRAYNALDQDLGINQREEDTYQAFKQAVDKIIELHPDILIHAGDLFDTPRPSNRAISFIFEQLMRLANQDIPVVIIAGNHSTPRMRDTGSIFQLFKFIPNLHPVFQGVVEKIRVSAGVHGKELAIHALPHCLKKEDFCSQLDTIEPDENCDYNVLLLHAAVSGIKEFSMGEFNEQEVPTGYLSPHFDYIALGHYHQFTQVKENCFYSGSTERFSFNELDQKKGFIEFDLANAKMEFHKLDIRPMEDLGIIEAGQLDAADLMQKLKGIILSKKIHQKIIRLTVRDVNLPAYNALDFNTIKELTAPALHFDLRFCKKEQANEVQASAPSINTLANEFQSYISQIAIDDFDKERVLQTGLDYLESAASAAEEG